MTPLAIMLAVRRHTLGEIKNCVPVRPLGKSIKVFSERKENCCVKMCSVFFQCSMLFIIYKEKQHFIFYVEAPLF